MYQSYHQAVTPDETAATGLLQHLNKDELQRLLDDDTKLEDLIRDLPQLRNLSDEKQTMIASNKSVAEYNLSRQPRLAQAKSQLASTYEKAVEVQKSFETNKQKLDYLAAQQNLDTTLALLQTRAATSEEDTEELSDKFLQGEVDVENFLENYISQRKVAHQRRVKVEKMRDIMQGRNQGPTGGYGGGATPSANNWNQAPYSNYSAMPNHNHYYR